MGPIPTFFFASQEGDPGTESGMTSSVHSQSGMTSTVHRKSGMTGWMTNSILSFWRHEMSIESKKTCFLFLFLGVFCDKHFLQLFDNTGEHRFYLVHILDRFVVLQSHRQNAQRKPNLSRFATVKIAAVHNRL